MASFQEIVCRFRLSEKKVWKSLSATKLGNLPTWNRLVSTQSSCWPNRFLMIFKPLANCSVASFWSTILMFSLVYGSELSQQAKARGFISTKNKFPLLSIAWAVMLWEKRVFNHRQRYEGRNSPAVWIPRRPSSPKALGSAFAFSSQMLALLMMRSGATFSLPEAKLWK